MRIFRKFQPIAALCTIFVTSGIWSCSPRVVTVETVRTEYRDRVQVDTTYQRDSIRVYEFVKGDTVRIVEYRDRWRTAFRYLRDTVALRDTVTTVREVSVEKPLTRWQRLRLAAFPWLLLAAGVLAAWVFRRPLAAIARQLLKL